MAVHFYLFFILRVIPYFYSVDPVQIRFSMLQTPYMQIVMLSSVSAHLFDISTQLLVAFDNNTFEHGLWAVHEITQIELWWKYFKIATKIYLIFEFSIMKPLREI